MSKKYTLGPNTDEGLGCVGIAIAIAIAILYWALDGFPGLAS